MNDGKRDRIRGVTLRVLDLTSVVTDVNDQLATDETASLSFEPYAMAEHDGHLYVICHEGVGWEITEDDPLDLGIYVTTPSGFGIFPRYSVRLSPDEVRAAATDTEVDLVDLVRSFGARLETNYWAWYHALTLAPIGATP